MPDVVTDPVCGMQLNREDVTEQGEYRGHTYYFCSDACRNKFDADPAQFASPGTQGGEESGLGRRP